MMRPYAMKSGSALLVVLGMLAFMLFSGLAFSVYMRFSRLPTSFLRRTVTTRQLTKAALAEAIEQVDRAIGNDPHPGIRTSGKQFSSSSVDNFWSHHVFIGQGTTTNPNNKESSTTTGQTLYPALVGQYETVATMPLEGLAFLPPYLINEVRYYSQRSPTSKWHSFWFDSGRFAYTAVDVSDCFDVNRVLADKPRAACGSRRISLAHIFEKGADHTSSGSGAKEWDTLMQQFRTVSSSDDKIEFSECPAVTMADVNLAWGSKTVGGLSCPFYSFLKANGEPYKDASPDENDEKSEQYRQLAFVTESYVSTDTDNKTSVTKKEKRDLAAYQPFRDSDLNGSSMPNLEKIATYQHDLIGNGSGCQHADIGNHLCVLGWVQLWDYLDINRVPVSLALPTLERVPMVVGIEPNSMPEFKVTSNAEAAQSSDQLIQENGDTRIYRRTIEYSLEMSGDINLNVLAAYPFRSHGIKGQSETFEMDGRVSLFLSSEQVRLRTEDDGTPLHLTKGDAESGVAGNKNAVINIALKKTSINASNFEGQNPVKQYLVRCQDSGIDKIKLYQVSYQWVKEQKDKKGNWQVVKQNPQASEMVSEGTECFFQPLNRNGVVDTAYNDAATFMARVRDGVDLRVNAAVWVRISYNDSEMGKKVVDMVPACFEDDQEMNGVDNALGKLRMVSGSAYPLLRYDVSAGNSSFRYSASLEPVENTYQLSISRPKIIVNDPRFNYLPENWYSIEGNGLSEQDWLNETASMLGQTSSAGGHHDPDYYLFTSDAGYLQSVYELAYLTRFNGLSYETMNNQFWGNYSTTFPDRSTFGDGWQSAKDHAFMWYTYRPFPMNGDSADPFEQIGLTSGETGLKVNPYSDSVSVLMAALANTPHDWRVAATNDDSIIDVRSMKTEEFNKKYAWNAYSSDNTGKLCWDCLRDFAEALRSDVRDTGNWESAFRNLGWSSDRRKLLDDMEQLDSDDSDLYNVDKKFLYGFWHDSFAAKQQLFLFFVRAEPMMMGGGVKGQLPPQLGAKAVALVWRDPTNTTGSYTDGDSGVTYNSPHRTRILFYHQFD